MDSQTTNPDQTGFLQTVKHTFGLVKFSHSIFALPFALASLFLAAQGFPPPRLLILVILCMVLARNTAMAFNRWVDAPIDAQNPRTSNRHLPSGILKEKFVVLFILVNGLLFILTTFFINWLSFLLSPIALLIVCFYSFTKRFTHWAQIFLGLSLGIAPIAAWIALKGTIDGPALLLGLAVLFWVAGFDIIYAAQDYDFDKTRGLKSLVVSLGISKALWLTRIFHFLCILLLGLLGLNMNLGSYYWITLALMALALGYENFLVSPSNLSRVNAAFFTTNGFVGVFYFVGVLAEIFLGHSA